MQDEIFVHFIDFKNSIPGTSTCNEDGSYSIFINSRMSAEVQSEAYMHELDHIKQLDFKKKNSDVDLLEYYAHKLI